jgi:hypothetical protein
MGFRLVPTVAQCQRHSCPVPTSGLGSDATVGGVKLADTYGERPFRSAARRGSEAASAGSAAITLDRAAPRLSPPRR